MTYGTGRANAYRILEDTLNLKDVRIYDYTEDAEGKKIRVLNKQETTLAQQKQQMIKDAFADWVWKDPERRAALTKKYNELFNSTRPREYDGAHINFAGMNPDIRLREHQKNAIAHVLYGGNTLLAHEVGAGKTFEMTAAAMESKRLGLCHKSMFVVPNHLTLQWATEFLRLYPSAKLLVAGRKDFEKKNRRKFCARIATGDYDAVIIGHSQFERIPISKERQQRMISEQIEEIENGIAELKHNRGDSFTIKQMEKTRKSLKVRLEKLNNEEKKDDVINFEELGVDRLFVDESQAFKNLFLYTKMRNVAGLSATEGNQNKKVQIYNYVTEGTFDAYLWQTLENKQRFISQIMTSKSPVRSCEDVDEQALSYAEVKALCAGNPLIKEKMDLDIEVARLKVLKADHKSQQFRLEDKVLKEFPDLIANTKERISAMQEDVNTLAAHPLPEDGFISMTVAGKNYTEKADAGKAILEACKQYKGGDKTSLGEYRGLAMQLSYDSFNNEHVITFKGASKHHVALGSDARGNITRIDNALAGISEKIAESEQKLEALQMQMANASAELGKPFPQEKELQEKTARLAELDALLNMDESSQQDDRTQENASETISDSKPSILSSLRETHVSEAHRPQESRQYLRVGEAR